MIVSARVLAGLVLAAMVLASFGVVDLAFAVGPSVPLPHGAPGPIVGAGLPVLAIGYGAYWLAGRFRRKPN
jgi:hypothetical protein